MTGATVRCFTANAALLHVLMSAQRCFCACSVQSGVKHLLLLLLPPTLWMQGDRNCGTILAVGQQPW
jgi:hypothetical protein